VFGLATKWAKTVGGTESAIKQSPNLQKTICRATVAIASAKFDEAYQIFHQSGIDGVNATLASYYLHLASYLTDEPTKAVILDDKVACALWYLETKAREEWRGCLTEDEIVADSEHFKISWNSSAYLSNLELVNHWRTQLICEPAQIELFLLQKGANALLIHGKGSDGDVSTAADILSI